MSKDVCNRLHDKIAIPAHEMPIFVKASQKRYPNAEKRY